MMKYIKTTLVQIVQGPKILLGLKKRGFGAGKWNGFGGKVQRNENLKQAAIRELYEECCVHVDENNLKQIAILLFKFEEGNQLMEVNVFKTSCYHGTPNETEEMMPKYFDIDQIPFDKMWKDDPYWYPLLFQGKFFFGFFKFKNQHEMISKDIKEAESFEDVDKYFQNTIEQHDFKKLMWNI